MIIAYVILVVLVVLLIALPVGFFHFVAWLLKAWPLWGTVFKWLGFAAGTIIALVFAYGFTFGWRKIAVHPYDYKHTYIPAAFEGYKIIQLSDFHIGTLSGHPEVVQEIVDKVNGLNPDLIVFTGDLVNMSSSEQDEFHEILRGFRAKDGVVSVLGNHDYMPYARISDRERVADIQRLQAQELDLGWHLLMNENYVVRRGEDTLAIVGVENDGDGKHFPQYADLQKAQADLSDNSFKILLSHDPTHWHRSVIPDTDIPLQLSGHTHAMQFKLFGWSPSKWIYSQWYGRYDYDDPTTGASTKIDHRRTLIVSSGIGEVGIPFRFGAWPEIVEITLHRR